MGFWGDLAGYALGGPLGALGMGAGGDISSGLSSLFSTGANDPSNQYRDSVSSLGSQAGQFGGQLAQNYQQNQAGINHSISQLQGLANGQNSVSAEQLRQGNQQALAAQQSMAAGANPQNAAMAARNAAMNMGRQSYGLAGQQAVAGLQERQQAQQALAQLQLGQSGQNMQGALGGWGTGVNAYGQALGHPQNTGSQMLQGLVGGAAAGLVKAA